MRQILDLKELSFLVYGLGISGVSAVKFFKKNKIKNFKVWDDRYKKLFDLMPKAIDWSKLSRYEKEDTTSSSQTLACTGDVCEVVDIGA